MPSTSVTARGGPRVRTELQETGREGGWLRPGEGVPTPLQSYLVPSRSGLGLSDSMLQAPAPAAGS